MSGFGDQGKALYDALHSPRSNDQQQRDEVHAIRSEDGGWLPSSIDRPDAYRAGVWLEQRMAFITETLRLVGGRDREEHDELSSAAYDGLAALCAETVPVVQFLRDMGSGRCELEKADTRKGDGR